MTMNKQNALFAFCLGCLEMEIRYVQQADFLTYKYPTNNEILSSFSSLFITSQPLRLLPLSLAH
jgi:hypothetical protein